ncbi:hypothetical protein [Enhygromyxa salina]|uniref:Uncharacterized protein n=1 Tax=Enhygromyxa salina TaxID=215803 RepID=A0A2S9YX47_9BACT|nr:hypothetical protein [Enhygromyxa salina]PRQ09642.1 hypothetical protein ENSA7_07040 [Enhygromyxa salina]
MTEGDADAFTHEVGNLINNMYLQAQLLERQLARERSSVDSTKHARLQLIMGEMRRLSFLLDKLQPPTPPDRQRPTTPRL